MPCCDCKEYSELKIPRVQQDKDRFIYTTMDTVLKKDIKHRTIQDFQSMFLNHHVKIIKPLGEEKMNDLINRQDVIDAIEEISCEVDDGYGFNYAKWRKYFCDMPSAEPEWIPSSERLPEDDTDVLIQFSGKTVSDKHRNTSYEHAVGIGSYYDSEGWYIENLWTEEDMDAMTVEAWMPLPEPYQQKEE